MYNILVIVDPQNDFVTGPLGGSAAQAALSHMQEQIYKDYDHIFVTLDTHYQDYLQATLEGELLPIEHCIKGSEGWQIAEPLKSALELSPIPVTYIKKPTFGSIDLPYKILEHLEEKFGRDYNTRNLKVDIVGLTTDICVCANSIMLRSFFPNSHIYVIADACAASRPHLQQTALTTMACCQILPVYGEVEDDLS